MSSKSDMMDLRLKSCGVGYDASSVLLRITDWTLTAGKIHVVFGANGSGKSTLLKSLMGIQPLLKGTMTMGERPWRGVAGRSFDVQSMSWASSTPPRQVGLTVEEVLAMSGNAERAGQWLPMLPDLMHQRLSDLSDGQAQQVMIARAMLQTESWLILDEPTAFMDIQSTGKVWALVGAHAKAGGSVVLSTHDLHGLTQWLQSEQGSTLSSRVSFWCIHEGGTWAIPVRSDATALEHCLLSGGETDWQGPY